MGVEPFPFATVEDLRNRWPDMPPGSESHAAVMLDDASQFILDTCPFAGSVSEATRRRVVCAVVRRSISSGAADNVGFESTQMTAGPFSITGRPANPHGDFYLTRQERKALGCGRQVAFSVQVGGAGALTHRPWCDLAFGGQSCSCGALLTGGEPLWEA